MILKNGWASDPVFAIHYSIMLFITICYKLKPPIFQLALLFMQFMHVRLSVAEFAATLVA